jgi:uncharacterized membrane protein
MKLVNEIIVSSIVLLILDSIYIGINQKTFADLIVNVQRVVMQVKISGAIVCYALLIAGLNYFIIHKKRSLQEAFFFGVVIYGVFDSTNYAMLKKWSLPVAIMDTLWGGTLLALTTYLTYKLT